MCWNIEHIYVVMCLRKVVHIMIQEAANSVLEYGAYIYPHVAQQGPKHFDQSSSQWFVGKLSNRRSQQVLTLQPFLRCSETGVQTSANIWFSSRSAQNRGLERNKSVTTVLAFLSTGHVVTSFSITSLWCFNEFVPGSEVLPPLPLLNPLLTMSWQQTQWSHDTHNGHMTQTIITWHSKSGSPDTLVMILETQICECDVLCFYLVKELAEEIRGTNMVWRNLPFIWEGIGQCQNYLGLSLFGAVKFETFEEEILWRYITQKDIFTVLCHFIVQSNGFSTT